MVTAAGSETCAELDAVTVAGRGAKGRRPTVMGTAGSETRAERRAVAGRGARGGDLRSWERRRPTGARDPPRVAAASLRVAELATDEWERMKEELDESDIRACGGFLPLGRTGLASGTLETENGTGLASGTLGQTENGTGLAGGTLGQTENGTGLAGGTLSQTEDRTGLASGTLGGERLRTCAAWHATSSSRPWTPGSVASRPRRERLRVVKV